MNDVILTALLQARADGDDASAERLTALLADPDRAGPLIRQLAADAK